MPLDGCGLSYNFVTILLLIIIIYFYHHNRLMINALKCFTCDGTCFSESFCNCQTGICEGDYCFVEKTRTNNGFYIQKGCARSKNVPVYQCFEQKVKSGTVCSCSDGDFCNSEAARDQSTPFLDMLPQVPNFSRNISCHFCTSDYVGYARDNCKRKCTGDFCTLYKSYGGGGPFIGSKFGCGQKHAVIHLTYHLGGFDMLYAGSRHVFDDGSACTSYQAGSHLKIQECVCDGNLCNYKSLADHSLAVVRPVSSVDPGGGLLRCYSCVETSQEHLVHSTVCRAETCLGQFCLLSLESSTAQMTGAGPSSLDSSASTAVSAAHSFFRRTAGCLNSSRPEYVIRGCTQRWTMKKWEKIECICDKDLCNVDVVTATAAQSWRFKTGFTVILSVIFYSVRFCYRNFVMPFT